MGLKLTEIDRGWDRLKKIAEAIKAGDAQVKAGVLEGSGPRAEGTIDNVALAAIHEYGVPEKNIPERSFIRVPFDTHRGEYLEEFKQLILGLYAGKGDLRKGLARLGQRMVRDMRARIQRGEPTPLAPNAPSTIAAKGSSRPLIDTGQLVRSISYEVKE